MKDFSEIKAIFGSVYADIVKFDKLTVEFGISFAREKCGLFTLAANVRGRIEWYEGLATFGNSLFDLFTQRGMVVSQAVCNDLGTRIEQGLYELFLFLSNYGEVSRVDVIFIERRMKALIICANGNRIDCDLRWVAEPVWLNYLQETW